MIGRDELVVFGAHRQPAIDGIEAAASHGLDQIVRLVALRLGDRLQNHLHADIRVALEVRGFIAFIGILPGRDEGLVSRGIKGRTVVDDAPEVFRDCAQRLNRAVGGGETDPRGKDLVEQAELLCLLGEGDGVTAGQRHPQAFGAGAPDLLDEGCVVVGAEGRIVFSNNISAVCLCRGIEALTGITAPGGIDCDDRPLLLLARGEPGFHHCGICVIGAVDAEHPRHAGLAGQGVRLVDGYDIERVPAFQHRRHCQALSRCDGAGQDLVTLERQFFGLLAREFGFGLGVEHLDVDLAPHDPALRVGLRRRELDRPLRLVAQAGEGSRERSRHADLDRLLRLGICQPRTRGQRRGEQRRQYP